MFVDFWIDSCMHFFLFYPLDVAAQSLSTILSNCTIAERDWGLLRPPAVSDGVVFLLCGFPLKLLCGII